MKVRIRPLGLLTNLIKNLEIEVGRERCSVRDVLIELQKNVGKKFKEKVYDPPSDKLAEGVTILLNGRNIEYLDDSKTTVKDGDILYLMSPSAGG